MPPWLPAASAAALILTIGGHRAGAQETLPIQINAGDLSVIDRYFTGEVENMESDDGVDTSGVASPLEERSYRSQFYAPDGDLACQVDSLIPGGQYLVRLHFAELLGIGKKERSFHIEINGKKTLNGFDIVTAAGSTHTAVIEDFYATADLRGKMLITFRKGQRGNPAVNGIEILKRPLPERGIRRINIGGPALPGWEPDRTGEAWRRYFTRAKAVIHEMPDAAPEAVYQSEKFSDLRFEFGGYAPEAPLTLRLHFAELFHEERGKRVFNVLVNDERVIEDLDVFALSGGKNHAYVREVPVDADREGRVFLRFENKVNNPQICGIEVIGGGIPIQAAPGAQ